MCSAGGQVHTVHLEGGLCKCENNCIVMRKNMIII